MPEPGGGGGGGAGKSNKGLPGGLKWLSCLSGSTKCHRGKMSLFLPVYFFSVYFRFLLQILKGNNLYTYREGNDSARKFRTSKLICFSNLLELIQNIVITKEVPDPIFLFCTIPN